MEWKRDACVISTDPARLDREVIHRFLAESYWARGIPRAGVDRSIDHSLPFGLFEANRQVGFARVITDYATFAYLADVFVLESHRGRGLARWLTESSSLIPIFRVSGAGSSQRATPTRSIARQGFASPRTPRGTWRS